MRNLTVSVSVPFVSEYVDFHYAYEEYGKGANPRGASAAPPMHVHPFHQLDLFADGHVCVHLGDRRRVGPAHPAGLGGDRGRAVRGVDRG